MSRSKLDRGFQIRESIYRLQVLDWTEGKKGNIRALLCSMHTILWEGAKWHCEMHQMVTAADVKKAYRKACLAVHPDKVSYVNTVATLCGDAVFMRVFFTASGNRQRIFG